MLERSTRDPKVRTAAASALVAGGAIAAAKVVREHSDERRREEDSYRFRSDEPPRDGIVRIAEAQLDLTIELLRGAPQEERPADAVHEARKALKRLRALLRLGEGAIADQRFRHENRTLRDVGRALSGTRDAQVLLETLDGLRTRYREAVHEEAWSGLRASLAGAATKAGAVDPAHAASLTRVLAGVRERAPQWAAPQNGRPDALANGFKSVYRRGRRAYATASSQPNGENLHGLRKRAKDLWHSAQLLEGVGAKQLRPLKQAAHHLADLLGDDHDLMILREHSLEHPELLSPLELELLLALISARQQDLQREAIACAAELYGEKPKKLLSRMALG